MKKLIFLVLSIIILYTVLSVSSCVKDECNIVGGEYEFVLQFELSPADSVFHIGDTITITSKMSNPIYEKKTNTNYTLNDFKFYLVTSIYDMDTNIIDYEQFNYFDLLIDSNYWYNISYYSSGESHLQLQYEYNDNNYNIIFKLIPKKTGNFYLNQYSDINYVGGKQYFDGKCDNVDNGAIVYMNERKDNNFHVMSEAKNEYYKEWSKHKEKYLDNGGYCFKVID